MVRIVVAAVLGAAVLLVWSAASWLYIPWHEVQHGLGERGLSAGFRTKNLETGVYFEPGLVEPDPKSSAEEKKRFTDDQRKRYREGPVATVFVQADGTGDPLALMRHLKGLGIYFVSALTAAILVAMAGSSLRNYALRVLFVTLIGVYTAASANLFGWNYMGFPLEFSLHMAGDSVAAALLLGLTVAAVVRPR